VLKIKEKSKCSFSGGNAHIRRRTNFPAHVRAQVGKAYFNGTKVGQMPSGVYDFKVGEILLIKTFSVPPNPRDLVTVVSISSASLLVDYCWVRAG
jgi:hypothetical protein